MVLPRKQVPIVDGTEALSRQRYLSAVLLDASIETARAIAKVAAEAWWKSLVAKLAPGQTLAPSTFPADLPLAEFSQTMRTDAELFGQDLAGLSVIEAVSLIGRLYTQALPSDHRSSNGIFYTPPAIVVRLLDRAEEAGHAWTASRCLDPSCGGGAFLVEAALRMLAATQHAEPAIVLASIETRLKGWDLDPFAVWLSNLAVEAAVLPAVVASGRRLGTVAVVRDALGPFKADAGNFDLVMGNPPFGRIKDNVVIRERFARSLHGHPNLYGMFTDLAVHLARGGGIIAYLTPTSFLAGRYFKALRRTLRLHAAPVTIDLVESRRDVFVDVLQEVALSVFRKGSKRQTTNCAAIRAGRDGLQLEPIGTVKLPADVEAPWALPRSQADLPLVNGMHAFDARLSDWGYSVSTGPLVWNRHRKQLHASPGRNRVPVIWAEAVTQDGRFVHRVTKKTASAWFEPRDPADHNLVSAPCVLIQRTTAKEQHRRIIAAEMPAAFLKRHGKVSVENHLNMVIANTGKPKVPLWAVAAFFATTTADRVFRCINASVAVSASELEAMPLPRPKALLDALAAPDAESAVAALYGVSA